VGDTRACFVIGGELSVLTRDQNLASLLVDQGIISREQATFHSERHMLTQAVGTHAAVEPDVIQTRIPPDARILLSTDGLHDVVPVGEIAELAAGDELEAAAQALVQRANEYGGPDNVTVVLIEP
jgi:protein phosphatase